MEIQYVGTTRLRADEWQLRTEEMELTFRTPSGAAEAAIRDAGYRAALSLTERDGAAGLLASRWLAKHAAAIRAARVQRRPARLDVDALS